MIMESDLQARSMIPMALAIAAGVAFATLLTLVLIPSLLVILSDLRLMIHRWRFGVWPKRLAVEPAANRRLDLMTHEAPARGRWGDTVAAGGTETPVSSN